MHKDRNGVDIDIKDRAIYVYCEASKAVHAVPTIVTGRTEHTVRITPGKEGGNHHKFVSPNSLIVVAKLNKYNRYIPVRLDLIMWEPA